LRGMWLSEGARVLVDECARVKETEKVLIVTDSVTSGVAEALATTCHDRGADAVVITMSPRRHDEEPLPPVVASAMVEADVVMTPTLMGTAHTDATRAALASGTRILCLDQFNEELLASPSIVDVDYREEQPTCLKVADAFSGARSVRVTSRGGTDVTLNLDGREGNSHDGLCDAPGKFTCVPNIEANVSPVDGEGEGTIVIDGSIPHFGIGVLSEPIRLQVEKGYVTEVTGGRQAEMLKDVWESAKDPNVYLVA